MITIADLPTPALLLDLDVLEANLARMAARATELGVALRPHLKTHKCVQIAERQRALGASGVTVSTLYEAQVFADHGFDDITWAFPVILNRLEEARRLAQRVTLRLVLDSPEALTALKSARYPFHVWLKVDCGYHRAGVDPNSTLAVDLAHEMHETPTLSFDGILSHSGHAYRARGTTALQKVGEEERRVMTNFANHLRALGIDVSRVSVGSTPTMSAVQQLDDVTEARPGNYAFYDYSQTIIGSCAVNDCAVSVLGSVVSSQPGANRTVIDAGALALSKDTAPADAPHRTMGEIFEDYHGGTLRRDARVVSVSQEHGVVNASIPVGSRVRILPNHSCLTTACFDQYHVVQSDRVVDRWKIWRGR
jgi:D-serine deaminase-like pyridoxal phosphate-dependent protein